MDWMAVIPGLAIAAAGLGLSYWWFGLRMRNRIEASAGVQALSAMKWRECAGLVLEALSRQGYREESSSRQIGEGGGTEFMLRRGDDPVLLSYKHGAAYRLGDSNIREFANAIQLCGASHGLLVTLGSIEDVARTMARRYEIRLLDGRSVWPMVESLVPDALQASIRQQAGARIRTGLLAGFAASVVLGSAVAFLGVMEASSDLPAGSRAATPVDAPPAPVPEQSAQTPPAATPNQTPAPPSAATTTGSPPVVAAPAPTPAPVPIRAPTGNPIGSSASIDAANKALEEIAKLGPSALAKRRAEAALRIAGMAQVRAASWSTQSTLVLGLNASDGKDANLVTEACQALSSYEELRYTRLQLEPPAGSEFRVRWRMCQ